MILSFMSACLKFLTRWLQKGSITILVTKGSAEGRQRHRNQQGKDQLSPWLIVELKDSATKAQVLDLSEVWKYYCELAQKANEEVSLSFLSRRTTLKDKLQSKIADIYDCVILQPPEKQVLLIPKEYQNIPFSELVCEEESEFLHIPKYHASEVFLGMVHVALKLRSDVLSHSEHKEFAVSEENMISSVPENLFMFLRLILGGQSLLEEDLEEDDPDCDDQSQTEARTQKRILSLAQDFVYSLTGGKRWTPKHIGLGCALHQATRSKELVNLFPQCRGHH